MKHNIFSKALLIAATAGLALSACSPEDFDGVSEAGLPLAENAKVTASVDDETNTVTFNMEGDGIYPMWYIPVDGKEVTKNPVYSTVNPLQKIWVNSGDYKVYYRVGNRNGMSQGMGETTFHVTNTLVDFSEIVGKLSGKEWRIAATEPAHRRADLQEPTAPSGGRLEPTRRPNSVCTTTDSPLAQTTATPTTQRWRNHVCQHRLFPLPRLSSGHRLHGACQRAAQLLPAQCRGRRPLPHHACQHLLPLHPSRRSL